MGAGGWKLGNAPPRVRVGSWQPEAGLLSPVFPVFLFPWFLVPLLPCSLAPLLPCSLPHLPRAHSHITLTLTRHTHTSHCPLFPGGSSSRKPGCETVKPASRRNINHLRQKVAHSHSFCDSLRLGRKRASLFRVEGLLFLLRTTDERRTSVRALARRRAHRPATGSELPLRRLEPQRTERLRSSQPCIPVSYRGKRK